MILKKWTQVKIITGKDKGKVGKIIQIINKTDMVLIAGINVAKKHAKQRFSYTIRYFIWVG